MDLQVRLRAEALAPKTAREYLAGLNDMIGTEALEDLRLVVSELVTNSYRHGFLGSDGWIRLHIEVSSDRIRGEVLDPGRGFRHVARAPSEDRLSGWGLQIVDRIADRWGVDHDDVTRVWFELGRDRHARRAAG